MAPTMRPMVLPEMPDPPLPAPAPATVVEVVLVLDVDVDVDEGTVVVARSLVVGGEVVGVTVVGVVDVAPLGEVVVWANAAGAEEIAPRTSTVNTVDTVDTNRRNMSALRHFRHDRLTAAPVARADPTVGTARR